MPPKKKIQKSDSKAKTIKIKKDENGKNKIILKKDKDNLSESGEEFNSDEEFNGCMKDKDLVWSESSEEFDSEEEFGYSLENNDMILEVKDANYKEYEIDNKFQQKNEEFDNSMKKKEEFDNFMKKKEELVWSESSKEFDSEEEFGNSLEKNDNVNEFEYDEVENDEYNEHEIDKKFEKKKIVFYFLNDLLSIGMKKEKIRKFIDFKQIDREELLKKDCELVLKEYLPRLVCFFGKIKTKYENKYKIKNYIISLLEAILKDIGYVLVEKNLIKQSHVTNDIFRHEYKYYYSIIKNNKNVIQQKEKNLRKKVFHIQRQCKSNKTHNNICTITGNPKYDNYCTHCFRNLFPNDPRIKLIRTKSKEIKVRDYINDNYDGFVHDKPLYVDLEGGCCASKRRIDLRKLIGNTVLCIEIDENQHKSYDKKDEELRYDNLFMDFSGKYIFIRYNPDSYKVKGVEQNPSFDYRMNELGITMDEMIDRIKKGENKQLVEIYHLFYDEENILQFS